MSPPECPPLRFDRSENEYKATDPGMKITIESVDKPQYAIDSTTSLNLIRALYACPHGVISMACAARGMALRRLPPLISARVTVSSHVSLKRKRNDKNFDFENNPITTIIEGDWVHADGTTLGADNGIGMAASLAVMSVLR